MKKNISILAALIFGSISIAFAGEFEDGLSAAKKGDYEKALSCWIPLVELGHAEAQLNLGVMYANGEGVKQDFSKAYHLFQLASEQGLAEAHDNLEVMHYVWVIRRGLVPYDFTMARGYFNLGEMYANGVGVKKKDSKEAAKWYRLAAEHGYVVAQYHLGLIYTNGEGVEKDSKEAIKWYRLAAEHGIREAQYHLGMMYANGEGVEKNSEEAIKWYRLAATQMNGLGSTPIAHLAQYNLGMMYAKGVGIPKDSEEAAKWYRLAAEHGRGDAQYQLGELYATGQGVVKNRSLAYMLFDLAATHRFKGREKASHARDAIAREMPNVEIIQAQKLSTKWKPGTPLPTSITN